MKIILRLFIYISILSTAFLGGYRITDMWFRAKLIHYPFELYGIAVGSALVCWSFSFLQLVELLWRKRSTPKKGSNPYAVRVNRISEVELFK